MHPPSPTVALPYAIEITTEPSGEEFLWIADGGTSRMLKYDLDGNYLYGGGSGEAGGRAAAGGVVARRPR